MKSEELSKQRNMTYQEQLAYLKQKYGEPPENYFLDVNCTRKSTKNGRGNDGLFLHHDFEYDPKNPLTNNLSQPEMARQFDYDYQKAENLTYCDYLEHLMLHCKINVLRTEQLGRFIADGVIHFMVPEINTWFANPNYLTGWKIKAFYRIEDYYEDYKEILNNWVDELGNHLDESVTPEVLDGMKNRLFKMRSAIRR